MYCVGVINNIWGKRNRVKTYVNGSTSPLYDLSDFHIPILKESFNDGEISVNESALNITDGEYDFNRDANEILVRHIIDKYKFSQDVNERFTSRVFYYSRFKYKNPKEFSRESEIPYRVCLRAYQIFKQKLKQELCKY